MSQQRRPVIAGNWKMYKTLLDTRAFFKAFLPKVESLLKEDTGVQVVICPPYTSLVEAAELTSGSQVEIGAQNMNSHLEGAFTGEISPNMLSDLGVKYVILGHSERRQLFGETDEAVNLKIPAAFRNLITPIVCVGETLEEREGGLTDNVVIVQVQRAMHGLSEELAPQVIFAYEPVWAIGTGKTCDSPEANRVCGIIRDTVARMYSPEIAQQVRVLYGGSVKPNTIVEQMAQPDIDGALVGGASLDPESFAAIANFQVAE